ncbi:hypothetical protein DOK_11941 [gamma proteobacterium BDW918]|nr:hypothetical protein DOK_11941 [gamma proteobacterium BDW918]
MTIHVYHFNLGPSDKYWAIDDQRDASGNLNIWWGRRGQSLQHQNRSTNTSWASLAEEKLKKGYTEMSSLTVDRKTNRVVKVTDVADLPPEQPSSMEVSKSLLFSIKPFLEKADYPLAKEITRLRAEFNSDLQSFHPALADFGVSLADSTSVEELGQSSFGEIDFDEGPIAALLLFVLRRKLATLGYQVKIVVNSTSELVPEKPTESDGLFAEIRSQWLLSNTELPNDGIKAKKVREACILLAERNFFKKLCFAVGAQKAPLDLSIIEAPSAAAFF